MYPVLDTGLRHSNLTAWTVTQPERVFNSFVAKAHMSIRFYSNVLDTSVDRITFPPVVRKAREESSLARVATFSDIAGHACVLAPHVAAHARYR